MAGGSTNGKVLTIAQRQARAVELRKMGLSYRNIAPKIAKEFSLESYSFQQAFKDVDAVLRQTREHAAHDAAELREMELERYDQMLMRLMPQILRGDPKSIDSALKISQQRCRLLGLEAPVEIKISEAVENELSNFLSSLQPFLTGDTYKQVLNAIVASSSSAAAAIRN